MIFSIFYYLIAITIHIIALPYLFYKSTQTKYKDAIPARFFSKNNKPFTKKGIWFHSCSMGETKALKPLIENLSKNNNINISTITNTGYQEAQKLSQNVRYLPFEALLPFWINKQKLLVVMEAELWYILFFVTKMKNTPTVLINARISDKSYQTYKKFSWFYKQIFKNIDLVLAQTHTDKQRLEELGAIKVEVIGNIKLASLPKITKELTKPLNTFITTLASSHENEEELILNSYSKEMGKLIIVPRHPERFKKVDTLIQDKIKNTNITYSKYTHDNKFNTDIVLVDTMGELINIFAISDAVILGGAFEKIGGHNPIEPAFFGCRVISGEYIFNQKALFECVNNYKIIKTEEILDIMQNIKTIPPASLTKAGDIDKIIEQLQRYIK